MAGKKLLYIGIGCVAVAFASVGVLLPGIPTVPFILVAIWAFSQSSERLHRWLLNVKMFQSANQEVERFRREATIGVRTKVIAQGFAWVSFLISLGIAGTFLNPAVLFTGIAAIACSGFMLSVRTTSSLNKENTKSV